MRIATSAASIDAFAACVGTCQPPRRHSQTRLHAERRECRERRRPSRLDVWWRARATPIVASVCPPIKNWSLERKLHAKLAAACRASSGGSVAVTKTPPPRRSTSPAPTRKHRPVDRRAARLHFGGGTRATHAAGLRSLVTELAVPGVETGALPFPARLPEERSPFARTARSKASLAIPRLSKKIATGPKEPVARAP